MKSIQCCRAHWRCTRQAPVGKLWRPPVNERSNEADPIRAAGLLFTRALGEYRSYVTALIADRSLGCVACELPALLPQAALVTNTFQVLAPALDCDGLAPARALRPFPQASCLPAALAVDHPKVSDASGRERHERTRIPSASRRLAGRVPNRGIPKIFRTPLTFLRQRRERTSDPCSRERAGGASQQSGELAGRVGTGAGATSEGRRTC